MLQGEDRGRYRRLVASFTWWFEILIAAVAGAVATALVTRVSRRGGWKAARRRGRARAAGRVYALIHYSAMTERFRNRADTVFDGLRLGLLRRLEGWLIPSVGRWTGKEVTDFCLEVLEIAKGHSRAWTARRRRRARRRKAANDELVSGAGDPALVGAL